MSNGIIVLLFSIPILLGGLFLVSKKRFMETDEFDTYKRFSFFSPIVTFWILKLLLVGMGMVLTMVGIYFMI